jgi:phosphonate metabolism protein PhnN/1,5-bisphosphokinase (PRPP-forming)
LQQPSSRRGTLFLIVGPSGAGKDTLISSSRDTLGGNYFFPKRFITRPSLPDAEEHVAVTPEGFSELASQGAFALQWHAHGLQYAIPASITLELARGVHVVINVSRSVVDIARLTYAPVRVILVTASADVLARRLGIRNREQSQDVQSRLQRQADVSPDCTVYNDGNLKDAVAAFVEALRG